MVLRIGCVEYLNARPLVRGLAGEIVFDHPRALCRQLADGDLDVALVSSFEFIRNPIYTVVDGVCIASHGPVYSVFLAHVGKLSEIEKVEIDPASLTSAHLLQCLLTEARLNPRLIDRPPSSPTEVSRRLAKLFIGDQGIRFRKQNSALCFWDLGEEWQRMTQLPFVYALWLIRQETPDPGEISGRLRLCRDNNLQDLDSLINEQKEFSPEFCQHYFRENLSYYLGPLERQGLEMFRRLCEKHGIS